MSATLTIAIVSLVLSVASLGYVAYASVQTGRSIKRMANRQANR